MNAVCQACGKQEEVDLKVLSLTEVDLPSMIAGGEVRLCSECFETRRMRTWNPDERKQGRLEQALTEQLHKPAHRFMYLRDEKDRIHLVRVRPDWIEHEHETTKATR